MNGHKVQPKIVASTATVRRADTQIRALFNRRDVEIFPPPGPDRRDSFFAETHSVERSSARLYLGIAAQGRSSKVVMLRVYLALLASAQKWYRALAKKGESIHPADPYMTLLGYFNSLRELGGARRLIEDEVRNRLAGYGGRKRVGESEGLFANREISYEPVELTSRVSTAEVSEGHHQSESRNIQAHRNHVGRNRNIDVIFGTEELIQTPLGVGHFSGADAAGEFNGFVTDLAVGK